jgi:hypothetical protein
MRLCLLAIVLLCGQTAARADTIGQHGRWSVFADTTRDGGQVCGVRTALPDGAELRIVAADQDMHLVVYNPGWTIRTAGEAKVAISMDRDTYVGRAAVAGPNTLVVESLTTDFLARFMNGNTMIANFGGVRWAVDLTGSGRAAAAMAACAVAARHTVMS